MNLPPPMTLDPSEEAELDARIDAALEKLRKQWRRGRMICGDQERYAQTAKNIQIADALLTT